MSYGYLIASTSPIPELQKNRRFKFLLLDSSDGYYFYSRLEERNELTIRDSQKSVITDAGKSFITSMLPPFFFMDYLLTKKQNESDLIQIIKKDVKVNNFKTLRISNLKELDLNVLHKVSL